MSIFKNRERIEDVHTLSVVRFPSRVAIPLSFSTSREWMFLLHHLCSLANLSGLLSHLSVVLSYHFFTKYNVHSFTAFITICVSLAKFYADLSQFKILLLFSEGELPRAFYSKSFINCLLGDIVSQICHFLKKKIVFLVEH